jgi:hypothetical protein
MTNKVFFETEGDVRIIFDNQNFRHGLNPQQASGS